MNFMSRFSMILVDNWDITIESSQRKRALISGLPTKAPISLSTAPTTVADPCELTTFGGICAVYNICFYQSF